MCIFHYGVDGVIDGVIDGVGVIVVVTDGVGVVVILTDGVGDTDGEGLGVSEGKTIESSPLFGLQHKSGSANESTMFIIISSCIGNNSVPLLLTILNSPKKLPTFLFL